jgi:hypothetical protein
MSENKSELTRRDFLKGIGKMAAGFALVKPLEILGKNFTEKGDIKFREIGNREWITLQKSNEQGVFDVCVQYFGAQDKLSIRVKNGQDVCLPFPQPDGAVRTLGEITLPTIFPLKEISNLAEGINVAVYPTLKGHLTGEGRKPFPRNMDIYGIPVIVGPNNYFPGEGILPLEKNTNGDKPYDEFGLGYAIGTIDQKGSKMQFDVMGFVCDARALEVRNS